MSLEKLSWSCLKCCFFQSTTGAVQPGKELLAAEQFLLTVPQKEKSVFPPLDTSVIDIAHTLRQDTVSWQ